MSKAWVIVTDGQKDFDGLASHDDLQKGKVYTFLPDEENGFGMGNGVSLITGLKHENGKWQR